MKWKENIWAKKPKLKIIFTGQSLMGKHDITSFKIENTTALELRDTRTRTKEAAELFNNFMTDRMWNKVYKKYPNCEETKTEMDKATNYILKEMKKKYGKREDWKFIQNDLIDIIVDTLM